MIGPINKEIAECVGLWLAEGDQKSLSEITFTNNSTELVKLFYKRISHLFSTSNFRLYVYLPSSEYEMKATIPIKRKSYYVDSRANKPYFILRLGSKALTGEWKGIVNSTTRNMQFFHDILRGFFAGEGNIKEGLRSRVIRISQKQRNRLIDDILGELGIGHVFSERERAYVISGRYNWKRLAEVNVADLHPAKKERFWKVYKKFKEWHYSHNHIRNNILPLTERPITSMELANMFKRDQTRIQRILTSMKREGSLENFRVGSKDYWTCNKNLVIISKRKGEILNILDRPNETACISKRLGVTWKSASRRLKELERLRLVRKAGNLWYKSQTDKEVIIL